MEPQVTHSKVAFFMDERLPHDRKAQFAKLISILKPKYHFEVISSRMSEIDFIDHLKSHSYDLILMPWYRYLSWKKLETHFGALRFEGPTVAGYFADAVLPMELAQMPSYHRLILLDFYRLSPFEIEVVIQAMLFQDQKAGFRGILPQSTPVFYQNWFHHDQISARCVDAILNTTLLRSKRWSDRQIQLRFFLNALWSLTFAGKAVQKKTDSVVEVEFAEFSKRLAIKYVAENPDLTLKEMMTKVWPPDHHRDQAVQGIIQYSDFLRIHHFPESHRIEITAFFFESSPAVTYPGEIRGFWIEPQKQKHLMNSEDEAYPKRIPVFTQKKERLADEVQEILEQLKAVHLRLGTLGHDERFVLEHQVSNLKFLVESIEKKALEKKVAEKKKIA